MSQLYRYQQEDVKQIDRFDGRVLLANEMGTGKTITSLWWAKNYLPSDARILIICPASVKYNWQREASYHCGMRSEVLSGLTPPDDIPSGRVWIINYDILHGQKDQQNSWLRLFLDNQPDLIICDECHYIKSMKAKRSRAVREICKRAPHVIMISGTPLTNRPVELYPALSILLPGEFSSFVKYAFRYCDPQRNHWGWQFKGATNLDELHERLEESCMIRRRKRDVLSQLPAKTRSVVPLELSSVDRMEYARAEKDFITWLRKVSPREAHRAEKAEYLVRRGYLKRLAASLKLPLVIEWLDNFLYETEEKLILFGVHKKILGPLYKRYKNLAEFVDGSVTGRKRQKAFDGFTNRKEKRLLVGNIQAAGVGWNGQVANNVAFAELGWTPGEHTQGEDRTHRIGQTRGVMCHYLVAQGTIEEDLCNILQTKQRVLSSVLDGSDAIELDIMLQLEKKLLEKHGVKL